MKRQHILFSGLLFPIDFSVLFVAFLVARLVRENTDKLSFLALPIQKISESDILHFAIFGALLFCVIAFRMGLYSGRIERAKALAFSRIPRVAGTWFFVFISVVYLGNGYLYTVEIPRLVIFLVLFLAVPILIFFRYFLHSIYSYFASRNQYAHMSVIGVGSISSDFMQEYENIWNAEIQIHSIEYAGEAIRNQHIDTILIGSDIPDIDQKSLLAACRIYGITPRIIHIPDSVTQTTEIEFVGRFPTVLVKFVRIEIWGRILKRTFDIILSAILIVLFLPIFVLIALAIFLEDRSGPIIYKNVRVGRYGKVFTLYKFRYMYWKYCVKEAYGVAAENDDALTYENTLAKSAKNSRSGPIYKIQGDERKMRVGKLIESVSFDELPQLFNVFRGDMSLVGPRPHQPREVEKYDEWHKQVLTVKPGITGMAQVYAREAQDFNNEVKLDRFYIENWSWMLDVKLLVKTLGVVWVGYSRKKYKEFKKID